MTDKFKFPQYEVFDDENAGKNIENAIFINSFYTEDGIQLERLYISLIHGQDWKKVEQALITGKDGRPYDEITINTKEGKEFKYYFCIAQFFGKYAEL